MSTFCRVNIAGDLEVFRLAQEQCIHISRENNYELNGKWPVLELLYISLASLSAVQTAVGSGVEHADTSLFGDPIDESVLMIGQENSTYLPDCNMLKLKLGSSVGLYYLLFILLFYFYFSKDGVAPSVSVKEVLNLWHLCSRACV